MSDQTAGSVNFDQNIVKIDEQHKMEAVSAAAEKPNVVIGGIAASTLPEQPTVEEVTSEPAINTLCIVPMLTLSYGNAYMSGLKELKSVSIGPEGSQETYNFYNPFGKANPTKNLPEGLIRKVFAEVLFLIQHTQGREVVYLGPVSAAHALAETISTRLATSIEKTFPLNKDEVLFELERVDDGGAVSLKFGDLFSVNTWSVTDTDESNSTVQTTIYVNLVVNAGAFYDSEEPHTFVARSVSFLTNLLTKLDKNAEFNPFIAIAVNTVSLQDEVARVMLDSLLVEHGFGILSAHEASEGHEGWLPAEHASKVFVDGTDFALFRAVLAEDATASASA